MPSLDTYLSHVTQKVIVQMADALAFLAIFSRVCALTPSRALSSILSNKLTLWLSWLVLRLDILGA